MGREIVTGVNQKYQPSQITRSGNSFDVTASNVNACVEYNDADTQRDSGYAACPDNSVATNYPLDQNNAAVTLVFADKLDASLRSLPARLSLDEGSSGEFTVRLTTSPKPKDSTSNTDVTVTIAQPATSTGVRIDTDNTTNGNQNTLTFTGANWGTAQTVYVSTTKDSDYANSNLTLSLSASGGGSGGYSYARVTGSIPLTVRDPDAGTRRPYVTYSRQTLREGTETATNRGTIPSEELHVRVYPYWGAFASAPTALSITDVKGSVGWEVSNPGNTSADSQSGTAANTSLPTLIGAGGNLPDHYLIKFTAEDDSDSNDTDDAGAKFTIVSGTGGSAVRQEFDLRFKVVDDDGGPVELLISSDRIEVAEGSSSSYFMTFGSEPAGAQYGVAVHVDISSADSNIAAVRWTDSNATSTRLSINAVAGRHSWVRSHPFSVTGVDDGVSSSNPREVEITITVTSTAGSNPSAEPYHNHTKKFTVVVTEPNPPTNFTPSTLTRISGVEGSVVARSIALSRQPSANVTVALASDNSDVTFASDAAGSTAITSLSFTTSNWEDAQTFYTVLGSDADTNNDSARVTLTASGGGFDNVSTSYAVRVIDDDNRTVIPSRSPVVLDEDGGPVTVGVRLSEAVTYSGSTFQLTFDVSSSDPSAFTVSPDEVQFDDDQKSWDMNQTLTLTPVNDSTFTSAIKNATVIIAAPSGTDSGINYSGFSDTIPVEIRDDDLPPLVLSSTSLTVDEGDNASFTVKLDSQPTTSVRVTLAKTSASSADVTFDTDDSTTGDQSTLTFTTSNWNTAQTVEVSTVH
ncbi:MAG: hypothetical protein ISN29_09490, partial [Gammaproteobacteria bacterium AqS3]|nr:hypothetical protein [Gammaproteobacteria bacterium AqS3]